MAQFIVMKAKRLQCPHLPELQLARVTHIEPGRLSGGKGRHLLALCLLLFALLIGFHPLRWWLGFLEMLVYNALSTSISFSLDFLNQLLYIPLPFLPALL